jgi:hypothetical protein
MSGKKSSSSSSSSDKKEEAKAPEPPKRRLNKIKTNTVVGKAAVEVGSAKVEQWQRTPLQMITEYCQKQKRPKAMCAHCVN